jgi:hypothetical protein
LKLLSIHLSLREIKITAHIHWAIASLLKIFAVGIAVESAQRLTLLSIIISLSLGTYALIQGRDTDTRESHTAADWWVYVGLVEIAGTAIYARLIWTQLSLLDQFRAIIISVVAFVIYQIPWQGMGWRSTPWHRTALVTPALTALIMIEDISDLSLLVVAVFTFV